jgi:hypothetical protein
VLEFDGEQMHLRSQLEFVRSLTQSR